MVHDLILHKTCSNLAIFLLHLVSLPIVNVTALNNATVGQSLTLQCNVTTVRGITSGVNIEWSSGGTVVRTTPINETTVITMNNSLVYTDTYRTPILSTSDNLKVIECRAVINVNPPVMSVDSLTLNVDGEFCVCLNSKVA